MPPVYSRKAGKARRKWRHVGCIAVDICVEMFDTSPMMTLNEYLSAHPGKTHEQWAAEIGISRSHFTQIASGSAFPSRKVIQRIDIMTGGQVSPAVWYRPSEAAE